MRDTVFLSVKEGRSLSFEAFGRQSQRLLAEIPNA